MTNAIHRCPTLSFPNFLNRNHTSIAVEIGSESATASSACCNCTGRLLPLFSARRRIPAQAFGLKKNRAGTGLNSNICDREITQGKDPSAALRHAEPLRVQNAPLGESIRAERHSDLFPFTRRRVKSRPNHFSKHASKVVSAG